MLTLNFAPFPNLETEHLLLRRVNPTDIKEIFALRSNPQTMQYIPRPLLKTDDDALEHITMIDTKIETNEGINWAITLKDNPKLIGVIGHYRIKPEHYRAEIGYMLLPEYHGKGICQLVLPEFPCHRKSQVRTQFNKHKKSRKPLIFFKVSSLST